jgi:hypothetical protein
MQGNKDIKNLIEWINRKMNLDDFHAIFNIPSDTFTEIPRSIGLLGELLGCYINHFGDISYKSSIKKRECYLQLLFADIFGELAISIKMASEGYFKYSLRNIRATLDLIFAGLFFVLSWDNLSLNDPEGTNLFASAFFSGYWGKLKEIDPDQIVLSGLSILPEDEIVMVRKESMNLANSFLKQVIERFKFEESKVSKTGKAKQIMRDAVEKAFSELVKSAPNAVWNDLQHETFAQTNFYQVLMLDERFFFRSCENHEKDLLDRLVKDLKLNKSTIENVEEIKEYLTFRFPLSDATDDNITCDDCERPPQIFGLRGRLSSRGLLKVMKFQMQNEPRKKLDNCVSRLFSNGDEQSKGFFGDVIYSKLYAKLNDFSHANLVEEPSVKVWYSDFFSPVIGFIKCILNTLHVNKTAVGGVYK